MLKRISVLMIVLIIMGTACQAEERSSEEEMISFMSYNIRYDNPDDGINQWDNRKERVVSKIQFYSPDFLGIQEGLIHQVRYLDEELEMYDWIGVGRDDGIEAGELSSIYFNTERFELVDGTDQTIWLSETPYEPSRAWDAALPRILTFGRFRDRSSGREFYLFNTHFDHRGQTAREESARVILQMIGEYASGMPYIVMGDFNITEDNAAYDVLMSGEPELRDAYYDSDIPHVGPHFTSGGFEVRTDRSRRIDYIFVSPDIQVLNHAILSTFRDGYYPSDHLPVFARIRLQEDV